MIKKLSVLVHPLYDFKSEENGWLSTDPYSMAVNPFAQVHEHMDRDRVEFAKAALIRYEQALEYASDGALIYLRAGDPQDRFLEIEKVLFQKATRLFGDRLLITPHLYNPYFVPENYNTGVDIFVNKFPFVKSYELFGEYVGVCVTGAAVEFLQRYKVPSITLKSLYSYNLSDNCNLEKTIDGLNFHEEMALMDVDKNKRAIKFTFGDLVFD